MRVPVILAHGALGPYDELIMGGAAVIFLIMMGLSWFKSRYTRPDFEEEKHDEPKITPDQPDTPDEKERFRLD
ncbi:MAG TPA: hypothetical protein VHD90_22760 [Phototrophicaceae bacterium]|nr:hypothetical protein [Phototrophicaceae bacterium]